jgi:hypothetical protein
MGGFLPLYESTIDDRAAPAETVVQVHDKNQGGAISESPETMRRPWAAALRHSLTPHGQRRIGTGAQRR